MRTWKRLGLTLSLSIACLLFPEAYFRLLLARRIPLIAEFTVKDRLSRKCLLIGDSHIDAAFRDSLEECSNLAIGGTSISMWRQITEGRINQHTNKAIVLMQPHMFTRYRELPVNKALDNLFSPLKPYPNLIFLNPIARRAAVSYYGVDAKLEMLKQSLRSLVFRKRIKVEARYQLAQLSVADRKTLLESRLKVHMLISDPRGYRYLQDLFGLVRALRDKSITVCALSTPVTHEYKDKVLGDYAEEWDELIASVKVIGVKYTVDQDFIPYSLYNFTDHDHLNQAGSEKFAYAAYRRCFGQAD